MLGASGHIAGIINPASKNKRSYWTSETPATDPEQWLASATEQPGSWWVDWSNWLGQHAGKRGKPAATLGSADYPPLEAAPGHYVLERG